MIAQMFNHYLTAKLVIAVNEVGLFQLFESNKVITPADLIEQYDFDLVGARDLLRFLASQRVLTRGPKGYQLDEAFKEEYEQNFGMLSWLLEGYGNVVAQSHPILTGEQRYGVDIVRNAKKMASATAQISAKNTDSFMFKLLDSLSFDHAIDIGCGSGMRLLQLAQHYPHVTMSGIDISEDCCELARENIHRHGIEKQINIVCSSAEDWSDNITETRAEHGRNLILCFAMFHDLLNIPGCAEQMLASIRQNYPKGTYFVIQDQMCAPEVRVTNQDWVEGFTFVHRLMGQSLYPLSTYQTTLEQAGFAVRETVSTSIPENYLILAELV
ncbi:class I SAM-dependent methyltransferase [Pseudoalteromonas rubra]|uniref:Uncharacterized protein n=1 Tax=Pseudoalteromonas rubra TaxID=43658 RepID=A0A4Q7ELU7_9GAMM|nr:class I SAM-dependent methyltransferase [Pseudoalteromonas rubra]RZM84283.1 hypothetical protein C3B51_04015 [Pseudoalteromonas rubra]